MRAAIEHGVPFVFSFGIAGGERRISTPACEAFDALCARNGWSLDVGVVRSEVDRDLLLAAIADGQPVVPAGPRCGAVAPLTARRRRPTPSGSWP